MKKDEGDKQPKTNDARMTTLTDYPIKELKFIYNHLHAQLPTHTELVDSKWLQDIQDHLLQQALNEGIDISSPANWVNWLHSEN